MCRIEVNVPNVSSQTLALIANEPTPNEISFETEMPASEENLLGLMALNRELVGQAEAFDDSERVVLDMDSTESPVHGQQESSAYNGHFESVCYHPLLLFNGHGDCLAAKLRPGNVHSAEDCDELLLPEIERQQAAGKQVAFRGDAAFAKPEIYEALEERGADYAIRIPANKNLELEIEDILFRPPGRPSRKEALGVGRSAVQPAQSTSVSGWTSPGAYRRRSCAGFSAKRRGIRGSAGVYFHRPRAKMEILANV